MKFYDVLPTLPKTNRPEWATFIRLRSPEFKQHSNLGHAKSAINSSGHGVLYRWMTWESEEPNWTPVAIVEKGEAKTHPAMQSRVKPTEPVAVHMIDEEP